MEESMSGSSLISLFGTWDRIDNAAFVSHHDRYTYIIVDTLPQTAYCATCMQITILSPIWTRSIVEGELFLLAIDIVLTDMSDLLYDEIEEAADYSMEGEPYDSDTVHNILNADELPVESFQRGIYIMPNTSDFREFVYLTMEGNGLYPIPRRVDSSSGGVAADMYRYLLQDYELKQEIDRRFDELLSR
jgi:hypothetical protein